MGWDRSAPSHPKYRTPEHRRYRRRLEQEMRTQGYLVCAQPECVMPTRVINQGEAWHAGHDDTGSHYIGAVHARCNTRDGAKRARARQDAPSRWNL